MDKYDLVIIGGGPAGYSAAFRAAKLEKKVLIIEEKYLGGTCLNRGCIPTKTLLHTSSLMREIKKAETIGIDIAMAQVDMRRLIERKDEVTSELRTGLTRSVKKSKIDILEGRARIIGTGITETVTGSGEIIETECENILIASGSAPADVPIPGIDIDGVVNSDELLNRNERPYKTLIIIGGGAIGMEFATIYNDLGTKVVLIEAKDRILPQMDKEMSQNLKMIMKKRGADIHTSAVVENISEKISDDERKLIVTFTVKGKTLTAEGDGVLVSIGRRPLTDGIFPEGIGIEADKGYIVTDDDMMTGAPGIYAAGDAAGGIQLAHAAAAEGIRAVESMFGAARSRDTELIPSCVYTGPEIASVGHTAQSAEQAGIETSVGKYIMSVNGRSVLSHEERGFIKIVAEKNSHKVIGAQIMCARATDMIGEIAVAIKSGLCAEDIAGTIHAHPTFSEGICEAAASIE